MNNSPEDYPDKSDTEYISEYEEWVQSGNKKAEEIIKNTVAG